MPSGVRSVSWHGHMLTLGTGGGEIMFYDVRAKKFLQCDCNRSLTLKITGGWLVSVPLRWSECLVGVASCRLIADALGVELGFGICSLLPVEGLSVYRKTFRVLAITNVFSFFFQQQDEVYQEIFLNLPCPNAVYAHCYDEYGTRLFAAGGPIAASLVGNYAAMWE